ncbi:hypothetical protein [Paracoccus sp. (in: a-proteobacteria)]|uniref:hypothetical protein n=1 Tax=Paracoccus sp. TaxID=267 RepID=UPI003A849884
MDIFSKRDESRREDVQAKRLISENSHTIRRLADQISNGGYSARLRERAEAKKPPQPQGLIIHDLGGTRAGPPPRPYIKISLNGRVVLADLNNGKQLLMLGEIRGGPAGRRFVIATAENGFISPVDDDMVSLIGHLADTPINRSFSDKHLAAALSEILGLS